MTLIRWIGDIAGFASELLMLAAFAYGGRQLGRSRATATLLAALGVIGGATVWGVFFAAGGHPVHLPRPAEAVAKLALFATATTAFAHYGRTRWAQTLALLAVISVAVEYLT